MANSPIRRSLPHSPPQGVPIPGLLSNVAAFTRDSVPTNSNQTNIQHVYEVYASVQGRDLGSVSDDIGKIVADLEQGIRPWHRPWSAEHAAGRITRPLRHNGIPYKGINVVMLWSASVVKGYACQLWLTFKQALELGGNVKKGEHDEVDGPVTAPLCQG